MKLKISPLGSLGWFAGVVAMLSATSVTPLGAATAPTAITLSAQNITATEVKLRGQYNGNGAATIVGWDVGLVGGQLFHNYEFSVAGNEGDFEAGYTYSGLDPATTYQFHAIASNSVAITVGNNMQFRTLAAAPKAETLPATNITPNSARLQGLLAPNGADTRWFFQYGPSPIYSQQTAFANYSSNTAASVVTFDLNGIGAGANYHYRLVTSNSLGMTFGGNVSFETFGVPTATALPATSVSYRSARLEGTIDPNGLTTVAHFEHGPTLSFGFRTTANTLPPGNIYAVNAFLTNLPQNATYYYRLIASNALGAVTSSFASTTTPNPLPDVETLQPTMITTSSAVMHGTATTRSATAWMWFEFGATTNYGQASGQYFLNSADYTLSEAAVMQNLAPGQTYHYRVVASNIWGAAYGADVAFSTLSNNDGCSNAVDITSFPFTLVQSTTNATSAGEVSLCGVPTGKGVWFKTTVHTSGILIVKTEGSNFDTVLAVYSGTCGALTNIACNDDFNSDLAIRWSSNRVAVTPGTYYILAAGYASTSGTLMLNATFNPLEAPRVNLLYPSNIGARTATLRAAIDPGFDITTTRFVLFTNVGSFGGGVETAPQVNSSRAPYEATTVIQNLLPGSTNTFVVIASNSVGEAYSLPMTFVTMPDTSGIDITVPSDVAIGTSANSPGTQLPREAIDNNATTKYLNFDKLNAGLTIAPAGHRVVQALTLISAEDSPERDPSSFVLDGSNDGVNFIRIAADAVPPFAGRNVVQSIPIENTNNFNVYRLTFPTVANAATANSMQIAEVELLPYPEITSSNDAMSITLPPGAVDVRGVARLFDRDLGLTNKFEVAPIIPGSNTVVDITPAGGSTILKGFQLIGGADDASYPERRPTFVTVAGSVDGVNFTTLISGVPPAPSTNVALTDFPCLTNTLAFAHYRITFGPPIGGDRIQVGELRLFGEVNAVVPTLAVRATGGNLLVTWPQSPGFNLESKTNLNQLHWTAVTNAPVLSNGVNTVTLPMSGAPIRFFQLRK